MAVGLHCDGENICQTPAEWFKGQFIQCLTAPVPSFPTDRFISKDKVNRVLKSAAKLFSVFPSPHHCRICRKDKIPLTSSPRWASPCLLPAASTPQWFVFRLLSPACCLPPLVFVDNISLLWLLRLHAFMSSAPSSASSLALEKL